MHGTNSKTGQKLEDSKPNWDDRWKSATNPRFEVSGCPHCRRVKAWRARVHPVPDVTQHWANLEKVSGNRGRTVLLAENSDSEPHVKE